MQDIDYQLEKLERLAKLLEAGAISQTEYEEEKLSLLKPSGDEKSRQAADLVSSLRRGSPPRPRPQYQMSQNPRQQQAKCSLHVRLGREAKALPCHSSQ